MKYVDQACVWIIFFAGIAHILSTEIWHTRGVTLDLGFVWIFLAMFNLLRIGNGYSVKSLKAFCIGANLATLMFEVVRWKVFGTDGSIMAIVVSAEALFSIRKQQ
jgi:hypothetical protein